MCPKAQGHLLSDGTLKDLNFALANFKSVACQLLIKIYSNDSASVNHVSQDLYLSTHLMQTSKLYHISVAHLTSEVSGKIFVLLQASRFSLLSGCGCGYHMVFEQKYSFPSKKNKIKNKNPTDPCLLTFKVYRK